MTKEEIIEKWKEKLQKLDILIGDVHPTFYTRRKFLEGKKRAIYDCISDLRKLNDFTVP